MSQMKQSNLARTLRTTEYFSLAFGAMVGVGWLIVIDDWLSRGGPGGAMLGFLFGGLSLLPVAYVYGKFVREIPDASAEVAYATTVFPKSIGFGAGWLMTLAYLIVCPWEAVAIGKIAAYLFPAVQTIEIYRIAGFPVHLPKLVLGLLVTGLIVFLNYRGIRLSSRFQNYTTFGLLSLFGIFAIAGFMKGNPENLRPFFARGEAGPLGAIISIIMVLQIVPYFLTGFESVAKCSEEAEKGFSSSGFVKAIFLGLGVGVFFYVVIIGIVSALVPWKTLSTERFATALAFERAFHSQFLIDLLFVAALFSLLKVFNANFLTASRLVFALGRDRLIVPKLGIIHARFQTPTTAIVFCGVVTVCGALLGDSILIPVTEVGSMCSALGWAVTCIAFVKWRKTRTPDSGRAKEIRIACLGALVAVLLLSLKWIPWVPGSLGRWEYLALAIWIGMGLLLRRQSPSTTII
jgi:basic amino acid/polyamine antiporter, APA family